MSIITNITPQKHTKERVNIFVDGEFAFGLSVKVAQSLQVGMCLTTELQEQLNSQETTEKAYQAALKFLSYRPRSTWEVQQSLQKKGLDDSSIDNALGKLREQHLLDDKNFVDYWIEQRETFKPRSHYLLRQELKQKGISTDYIEEALETINERESAYRAGSSKAHRWVHLSYEDFQNKMGQFLRSRYFSYDIIQEVVKDLWLTERD